MKNSLVSAIRALCHKDRAMGFALDKGHIIVTDGKHLTSIATGSDVDLGHDVYDIWNLTVAHGPDFPEITADGKVLSLAGFVEMKKTGQELPDYDAILPKPEEYHETTVLGVDMLHKILKLASLLKANNFTVKTTGDPKKALLLTFLDKENQEIACSYVMPVFRANND